MVVAETEAETTDEGAADGDSEESEGELEPAVASGEGDDER